MAAAVMAATGIVAAAVMAATEAIGTATVTATPGPTSPARAVSERRKRIVRAPSVPLLPPRAPRPLLRPRDRVVSVASGGVAVAAVADAAVAAADCARA
jgi:hypothetical protein